MEKRFLSDIIGDDYKNWKAGQSVLACTSTGSGKTWFVVNRLLPYAKTQGKHVVYYCNRKFLNMQVQASARKQIYGELGEDKEGLAPYLHVRTYQHTEHQRDFPNVLEVDENGNEYLIDESKILYYVFDEAMYPVQDASFNSSTQYWYKKASELTRKKAVTVFLTATPEPFYLFRKTGGEGIRALFQEFVARYSVSENIYYDRWSHYLNYPGMEQPALKVFLGDPYAKVFDWIQDAYTRETHWVDHYYAEERSLPACYDYADTYYFDEIDSLAHLIEKSVKESQKKSLERESGVEDAWLVFVRTLEDAKSLRLALKTLDCSSVVISSQFTKRYDGKPAKRNKTNKEIFYKLVNEEYLGTHVLISTSVLDCGVTLHAKNVKNLVICQPNKTSFLQMLGRIRVGEGERINLYIQSYTPKIVEGYTRKYLRDFLFLAHFLWINEESPKSHFMNWREPDILAYNANDYMLFLPDGTREWLIRELEKDKDRWRFLIEKGNQRRRHYDLQSVKNLSVNELALIHYLIQIYYYKVQLSKPEEDPYYFLKEQLSWIGKAYDPVCWIDHQSSREKLYNYLTENSEVFNAENPMDKEAQAEFREKCFECMSSLREPPEAFVKAKKRHTVGSDNYPGKSKLNEIFTDMGIPYRIESKQNKAQKRDRETEKVLIDPESGKPQIDDKSYWYLIPVDVALEQQKLDVKRETRRIRQEERKAQKVREEAQMPKPEKVRDPKNPYGVVIRNYPKKKKVDREEAIEQKPPKQEKKSLKVQIMYGNEPWDPSKQKER